MFRRLILVVPAALAAAGACGTDELAAVPDDHAPDAQAAGLAGETDAAVLASRIRELGSVDDAQTADLLLDFLGSPSELVRTSAAVALLRTTAPACLERVRVHGLVHTSGVVRAHAARVCGRLKLASAEPKLRAMIEHDELWLARSEAAIACGELGDVDAKASIVEMLASDPSEKARLAAMDALGLLGPAAADAVPAIAVHLTFGSKNSRRWQLRVAACQALARIGSMDAVEPLIHWMDYEDSGRVGDEIHGALATIVGVDLGRKVESWWNWWEGEKASGSKWRSCITGPEVFVHRVAFVLDTSASMEEVFDPDPASTNSLTRTYSGRTKLAICKEEIAQAISSLDPRAHFSIVACGPTPRTFSDEPVRPLPGNLAAAGKWLGGLSAAGEADAVAALRATLRLDESPDEPPDFRNEADTVVFLTDGLRTVGGMTPDLLAEWYSAHDRYARIRTNVIALGSRGAGLASLRDIAERSGGRFAQITGRER